MIVSVIVPAYNEEANLGTCLECLAKQTLPRDQFEVIVVDNGSTDSTLRVAEAFTDRLSLRIVSRPKASISAVRNFGTTFSEGNILAFLDADCFAAEDWLQNAVDRAPEAAVWGAHYLIPGDASWVSRTWFAYQAKPHEGAVPFLPAGDMFLRRTDFDRIGGFDESVETSEDVDLCTRASHAGLSIFAINDLAVVHEGSPRTLSRFYRQNRWHGRQVLRVFLLNLPSLRNAHIVAISFYTLALFWTTVAAGVYAVVHRAWMLPIVSLVLLLLPPFLFSLQRTSGSRTFRAVLQLWVLYLVYLLARAAALTHVSSLSGGARRSLELNRGNSS